MMRLEVLVSYINDTVMTNNSGTLLSFAYDTVILYEAHTWDDMKEEVQDMNMMMDFFNQKSITINFHHYSAIPMNCQPTRK
ncbi:hypothetical protein JTB14_032901 [Gonioctena quinquepunctata]|nr:hypothetical protein JTB14_032901 [Gonioctena quinquepunctata]